MRASTCLKNKQNYGAIRITYLFLIPKSLNCKVHAKLAKELKTITKPRKKKKVRN